MTEEEKTAVEETQENEVQEEATETNVEENAEEEKDEESDKNPDDKDSKEEKTPDESKDDEEIPEDEISPLNKYQDKLLEKYPDKELNSEEDVQQALDNYIDELENVNKQNSEQVAELNKVFESAPVTMQFLRDILDGASEIQAIARNFDEKALKEAIESKDKEVASEWAKGKVEREKRLEETKKQKALYDANLAESVNNFDAFVKEKKLNAADINNFNGLIESVIRDIQSGKVTPEFMSSLFKGSKYDNDIQEADKLGEIRGKNKKIITRKKKEKEEGDTLPNIKGGKAKQEKKVTPSAADEFLSGVQKNLDKKRKARE